MPINWGSVFNTVVDVAVEVGAAAMKIAVIDNAVDRCRGLSEEGVVLSFTREVAQMDDQVWSAWRMRLTQLANYGDQTASFMLKIGDYTRQEMERVHQLSQFQIDEAIDIAIQRMHDQSTYEQMCFVMTLATFGESNLKAEVITKRLVRMLSSGQ